ncbi:tetratricopeptide repeat protein [bacterium]|nr:tetratricopeptide repeat protein [bacterium]
MQNLIPYFIHNQYKKGNSKGEINAVTMFIDIVGFTAMTQSLIKYGKEGAEIVSDIINKVFKPAIHSIYSRGGWITGFAGDAFTAVFPQAEIISPIYAAQEMRADFWKLKIKTKFDDFKLKARIGLSYGRVDWGIITNKLQNTYYFQGEAIDGCANSEHHCKPCEIIIDNQLKNIAGKEVKLIGKSKGYYLLDKINANAPAVKPIKSQVLESSIVSEFIPESVLNLKEIGEFRDIVSVFISFLPVSRLRQAGDKEPLHQFVQTVIEKVHQYGGYFNKIDFGDKGGIMLVLFGAPVGIEKFFIRAFEFALDLRMSISQDIQISMGITSGMAYTGFIGGSERSEYTAIGEVVNLSARLVLKAKSGDIYFDEKIYREVKGKYKGKRIGKFQFKGFSEKLPVYKLLGKVEEKRTFFEGSMVGREKELAQLINFIKPISDGKSRTKAPVRGKSGGIIYIDGSAGIGKSRLVNELYRTLESNKYNWFRLSCDEILRQSFNPVVYFAKNYFNQKEENSPETNKKNFDKKLKILIDKTKDKDIRKELERTKSIIGALINLHWEDSLYEQLDAKSRYENTLYAFKNLIKAECLLKPTIIVLEDSHRVDADTVELLKVLTRNVGNFPFIIISPCRLKDDGSVFRFSLPQVPQNAVLLEHLNKDTAKALVEERLGGKVFMRLFELVWEKSEGNPFFIEQIILYLKESDALTLKEGFYYLTKEEFEIPSKINAIIISRIDRLSAKMKDLVKTASVLGKEFSVRVLSAMLKGKPIEQELKYVEEEAIWTALSEILYIFKHALIRDTVYEMQLKKTLRVLHKLAAETMEELYKDEIELHYGELAHHYENAEIKDKAKEYLQKAGDHAKEKYRNEEALNFYDRVLKYVDNREEEIEVYSKKFGILDIIGKWNTAIALLKKSIELVSEVVNRHKLAELKAALGRILRQKGDYENALVILNEAKEISESIDDRKVIADSLNNIGIIYDDKGDYASALEYYQKALAILEQLGDKRGISYSLNNVGIIYKNKGDYASAFEYYQKSLAILEELGDKRGISFVLNNIGFIYKDKGDYASALEYYQKALAISEELGYKRSISIALNNIGIIHDDKEGDYRSALEYYQKSLVVSEELGYKRGVFISLSNIGGIYLSKGDYASAFEYYQKALAISEELGYKRGISFSLGSMGETYKKSGDYLNAEEYINKAIAIGRELQLKYLLCEYLYNKADLCFILKRIDEASSLNDEALQIAEEVGHPEVIFGSKVLKAKILGQKDKKGAAEELKNMLKENTEDSQQATLHYELFKITGKKVHKTRAFTTYRKLYKKTPNIQYKEKMEELKK